MFDFEMPPLDWREARITKKSGGYRKLCIPNDALKEVQEQILQFLYYTKGLWPTKYAHGFVPFRSTITSVQMHDPAAPAILCCDVKDFFDNFPVEPVKQKLLQANISPFLVEKILQCCTYRGAFPQGSPCSPWLTNLGMTECDLMLGSFAEKRGMTYTRYADDITMSVKSTTQVKKDYTREFHGIELILNKKLGLTLKHSKNHVIWRRGSEKRQVLGITIGQDGRSYNAPMKLRRRIRAGVHNLAQKIRGNNNRIYEEDVAMWKVLFGYVCYFDHIRSFSPDTNAATADCCIGENDFNYLMSLFRPDDMSIKEDPL